MWNSLIYLLQKVFKYYFQLETFRAELLCYLFFASECLPREVLLLFSLLESFCAIFPDNSVFGPLFCAAEYHYPSKHDDRLSVFRARDASAEVAVYKSWIHCDRSLRWKNQTRLGLGRHIPNQARCKIKLYLRTVRFNARQVFLNKPQLA